MTITIISRPISGDARKCAAVPKLIFSWLNEQYDQFRVDVACAYGSGQKPAAEKPTWTKAQMGSTHKSFCPIGAFVPWAFINTFVVATTRPEQAELVYGTERRAYGRDGIEPSLYGFGSVRVLVKFVNVWF